MRTDI
jgi:hypothetical protein